MAMERGLHAFGDTPKFKGMNIEPKRKKSKGIPSDIKKFVEMSHIDVHLFGSKIMGVGLHWGESRRLRDYGFPKKRQKEILNWLENNPTATKKLMKVM